MQTIHSEITFYGGLMDVALREGVIDCDMVVNTYDRIAGALIIGISLVFAQKSATT